MACMLTMLLDHTREQDSSVQVLHKQDRSAAYGTVDFAGVAHLLREVWVDPPTARWYPPFV